MENRDSQTRGPRACITCAKAKARCTPGPGGETCERCHRLRKPCSAQTPAPPRKRKAPKPTRVADLERRLRDLTARVESQSVLTPTSADGDSSPAEGGRGEGEEEEEAPPPPKRTALGERPLVPNEHHRLFDHVFSSSGRRQQQQQQANSDRRRVSDNDDDLVDPRASQQGQAPAGNTHFPFTYEFANEPQNTLQSQSQDPAGPRLPAQANLSSSTANRSGRDEDASRDPWYCPAPLEAQQFLDDYRAHMAPLFPFVVIPPGMTAAQLRAQRPLLWKATMTAGLHLDAARQLFLGRELLNDILASAFLQPRKSFDILQALQVLVSWYHIIFKSFQLTNLLFLMRSICVSLGISESLEASKPPQARSSASLDQMRTYAGVYYLVTMVFTTNKKHDALMNTSYLAHCCRTLEEEGEYPGDRLVVLLVRTQQVSQSISMTLAFRSNSLPLTIIVNSFQHEISQLRASIAAANEDNVGLRMQVHIAEMLLYEAGLDEELAAGLAPPERLGLLWKCLQATRGMLELRFGGGHDRGPSPPRYIPFSSLDFTFSLLTCLRLSTLSLPGWDLRLVRREVDFNKYLDLQHGILKLVADMRREALAVSAGGGGRGGEGREERGNEGGGGGRRRVLPSGLVDPYECLQVQIARLSATMKAELAATLPPDASPTPAARGSHPTAAPGEETSTRTVPVGRSTSTDSSAGGGGQGAAAAAEDAPVPVPDTWDDLDEMMQAFHQSFWQDMDKVEDEWGMDFNGLMWGFDDPSINNGGGGGGGGGNSSSGNSTLGISSRTAPIMSGWGLA